MQILNGESKSGDVMKTVNKFDFFYYEISAHFLQEIVLLL